MTDNAIAQQIVDAAYKVHTHLGPGLLESVYVAVLAAELGKRGLGVRTQVALPVVYEDVRLDLGYRIDMIVAERVIVEIKSVEALADVHYKQLLTYLRLHDRRLGVLINFNALLLKGNVKRVVNGLDEERL